MTTRQLAIPTIGDELVLAQDWTFRVHNDHRNRAVCQWLIDSGVLAIPPDTRTSYYFPLGFVGDSHRPAARTIACTLPSGTRLRVDRIYIRKGKSDFDSLTFWAAGLGKKKVRFFARLDDVNQMQVLLDPTTLPPPTRTVRAILLREEDA